MSDLYARLKGAFRKPTNDYLIIGQVLIKKNLITDEQLAEALAKQQSRLDQDGQAVSLGHIIEELGYASEQQIVEAINEHYNIKVASLSDNIRELVSQKRGALLERLPAPRIPIWLQLIALTVLITLMTVGILNYVIWTRQKEQLRLQTVKIGMVSLNYFANNAAIPLLEDDILQLNTLIRNTTAVEGLLYGVIVDLDQKVKAHTDHNQIGLAFEKVRRFKNYTREGDIVHYEYKMPDGRHVLNLSQPIIFKDKKLGEVHVGISLDFIRQIIRENRTTIITITIMVIVAGTLMAILMGRHFSQPVSKLLQATREMSKGNYQYKVELARNDELGNLATAFNQMSRDLWNKSLTQETFGKYVGAEVLDMILANPQNKWLKGHRNPATTLIADIRGFTAYSDNREPEEVVDKLNAFFEIATEIILRHSGFVDKFMGDAVLCVFGVPVYKKNHVERAVQAAIELRSELAKANEDQLFNAVGISIDTGEVVSGNIGSQAKIEYTIIGDSVNAASRLNELAGPGDIIISQRVYEQLPGKVTVEPLLPQLFKGITEPMGCYKVLDMKSASYGILER